MPGSSHTIATTSPQPGPNAGTRLAFNNWSDGGALSHPLIGSSSAATFTAAFDTEYQLTTAVSPPGSGTVTPAPGGFFTAGTTVNLQATAASGFVFDTWTGPAANPSLAATIIVMSAPRSVTANFATPPQCTVTLSRLAASHDGIGDLGKIAVTATAACAWTAVSDQSWFSITSGGSGTGPGTVRYLLSANTTGSAANSQSERSQART